MSIRTCKLTDLVAEFGGQIHGSNCENADADVRILNIASLARAGAGDLSFFAGEGRSVNELRQCEASVVIVRQEHQADVKNIAWVVQDNPRLIFARAVQSLQTTDTRMNGGAVVAPSAIISADAKVDASTAVAAHACIGSQVQIGKNCQIHEHVVIGANCTIGDNVVLHPRVVLYPRVHIGSNCIVHAGAVIGADGFGYVPSSDGYEKIPQVGGVVIGNRVEIGANTTIDRGAIDDTLIGDGVKIDNLVQIGHNVQIGDNSIVCGCVGIAGSTCIGKNCVIGGACSISGHLKIGDGVQIAGASTVVRHVKAGMKLSSQMSALPVRQWQRLVVKLSQMVRR